jgi:hypothetical protein
MKTHRKFISKLLERRKGTIRSLITGDKSIHLEKLKSNPNRLFNEIEQIIFTINFLNKENLIKCIQQRNNTNIALFDSLTFSPNTEELQGQASKMHYLKEKLNEIYVWNIEMSADLLVYKKNGFITNEEKNRRNQFALTLLAAVAAIMGVLLNLFIFYYYG